MDVPGNYWTTGHYKAWQCVCACATTEEDERGGEREKERGESVSQSVYAWLGRARVQERTRVWAPGGACACEAGCAPMLCVKVYAYVWVFYFVESRAHMHINTFVCVHACARVWSHLASVASSSSSQISGLWRRCRPGSRCTAPASFRGSCAAGEQSVGGRVAPSPVASAGSNRWRWPLPCLRRNSRRTNSRVSVRVSSLFSCVHRRGRSADKTRHKPLVSALPAITTPYFSHNAVKSRINTALHVTAYFLSSLFPWPFIWNVQRFTCPSRFTGLPVTPTAAAFTERPLRPILPDAVCQSAFPWSTDERNKNLYRRGTKPQSSSARSSENLRLYSADRSAGRALPPRASPAAWSQRVSARASPERGRCVFQSEGLETVFSRGLYTLMSHFTEKKKGLPLDYLT